MTENLAKALSSIAGEYNLAIVQSEQMILSTPTVTANFSSAITRLKNSGVKVFVSIFNSDRDIFLALQEAYRQKLYGGDYLWFFPSASRRYLLNSTGFVDPIANASLFGSLGTRVPAGARDTKESAYKSKK